MKATAPAKINLHLRVVGSRANGMHEIETVFLPLDQPRDDIRLEAADQMSIESDHPDLPLDENNLCWKAAAAYAEAAEKASKRSFAKGWTIAIKKNIPVAAGLGGGSSDAAAVLNLLNAEHATLSREELHRLALDLGADVPFFLNPVPALASGVGEKLEPIAVGGPPPAILVVAPMFPVRAAWAYQKFDERQRSSDDTAARARRSTLAALKVGDWKTVGQSLHNDLAPALYDKFPLLRELGDFLREDGIHGAEISGSGPTLFAICAAAAKAKATAKAVNEEFGDSIQCFVTTSAGERAESTY